MLTVLAIVSAASAMVEAGSDAGAAEMQTVAKLLEAFESRDSARIDAQISADVAVEKIGSGIATGAALARYAQECPLRHAALPPAIAAPPGVTVVEVRWACEGRADNEAYFRFVNGRLDRISFGAIPIFRVR
ncbi:MAG: hypothetical protein ACK40O_00625 [Allosphingosinicella sp.]